MGMYTQTGGVPPVGTPQGMMHQQSPQMHQGQQQPPPNSQNTQASLPSPLYPWMRSQFGKFSPTSHSKIDRYQKIQSKNYFYSSNSNLLSYLLYLLSIVSASQDSYAKIDTFALQAVFDISFHVRCTGEHILSLPKISYANRETRTKKQ